MGSEPAANPWNADALDRGWLLWRRLLASDDPREEVAALLKDDLRCIVFAQLLEQRQALGDRAPRDGRPTGLAGSGAFAGGSARRLDC